MSRKCLLDCSANGAKWADDVQIDVNILLKAGHATVPAGQTSMLCLELESW